MDKKAKFLPFHAINEFMLDEFRRNVIQTVISSLSKLDESRQKKVNVLIRRTVSVPGFRNSTQAPTPMKINGAIKSFEKSAEFCAQILSGWSELHDELKKQVFTFLESREWEVLPVDVDRAQLPGFLTRWPAAETFEILLEAFRERHKEIDFSDDDISLMIVWVSARLPYEMVDKDLLSEEE